VSTPPLLDVRGLGKRFDVYESPWQRILEWPVFGGRKRHRELWAVRDVAFTVMPGQVVGIIGVNGAGKSTLVKLLTGVLDATEGSVHVGGRVLALPELGSDLNPALTGRQNVLVSAELLGLPQGTVERKLNEILEFSELGEFFEHRVNTYSTGMCMRLAFSMFASLDCELLIIDEAMAVGDVFFQQKCYERISELVAQNTAILLVTHDLNAIQHYCQEVVVLHQGHKAFQGDATSAIQAYVQLRGTRTARSIESTLSARKRRARPLTGFYWPVSDDQISAPSGTLRGGGRARVTKLAMCNTSGQQTHVFKQGETVTLCYELELQKDIGVPVGIVEIRNAYNILIHSKTSLQHRLDSPSSVAAGDRIRFSQQIELGLEPGDYALNVGLMAIHPDDYAKLDELTQQDLNERLVWVCRQIQASAFVVTFGFGRGLALTHAGVCDLPGSIQIEHRPALQPDMERRNGEPVPAAVGHPHRG
jgi:lipopolysaccharide transport system ATP-binding protein